MSVLGIDEEVLQYVRMRLRKGGQVRPLHSQAMEMRPGAPPAALVDSRAGRIKWVQPSGAFLPKERPSLPSHAS